MPETAANTLVRADPRLALAIPESHRWIAHGMGHLALLSRPEVHARIADWLMP